MPLLCLSDVSEMDTKWVASEPSLCSKYFRDLVTDSALVSTFARLQPTIELGNVVPETEPVSHASFRKLLSWEGKRKEGTMQLQNMSIVAGLFAEEGERTPNEGRRDRKGWQRLLTCDTKRFHNHNPGRVDFSRLASKLRLTTMLGCVNFTWKKNIRL